jgi:hypothetical protein
LLPSLTNQDENQTSLICLSKSVRIQKGTL